LLRPIGIHEITRGGRIAIGRLLNGEAEKLEEQEKNLGVGAN
jgi:hypothetical protein